MPHIVIEYSQPLADEVDVQALCQDAVECAFASGLFDQLSDIKSRAIGYETTVINLPSPSFVHVTIWLLDGRTDAQKADLTNAMADKLEVRLPNVGSLTVDIRDMQRSTYAKRVKTN